MATRMVEVWNTDSKDYSELFKGEMIVIPAKGFKKMEDPDASQFMGQFTGFKKDGQGNQLSVKALQKVYIPVGKESSLDPEPLKCMMCVKVFQAQGELDGHIASEHTQAMVDEDAKKNAQKSKFFR